MRYLTQIEGRQPAEAFVAYLLTQNIATHIEPVPNQTDRWEVWIRDEDAIQRAQQEFDRFASNPSDPRYAQAINEAREIIKQRQEAAKVVQKNIRQPQYRGPTNPLAGGPMPPLTLTLLLLSIAASILSNFSQPRQRFEILVNDKLQFVSRPLYEVTKDPAASIKRGEFWRLLTPIFLHGDALHLAMNMLGLVALGRLTERLVGTPRYALMMLPLGVLPIVVACMLPRALDGSPFTVGISGALYGLAAFLWLLALQRPELGFRVPNGIIVFMLAIIVLGFAGVIGRISNWAHLIGFLVGLVLALAAGRTRGK